MKNTNNKNGIKRSMRTRNKVNATVIDVKDERNFHQFRIHMNDEIIHLVVDTEKNEVEFITYGTKNLKVSHSFRSNVSLECYNKNKKEGE